MIELMKELCALPGPSGCEDAVRAFVLKRVKPFADEIRTDAIGNVMVFRKGRKALDRPVAVCAHMDEVGVIIKKITEDGMLKFGFVGGVDPRVVIGRPVRFGDVPGVIGIKAVHLTTAAERRTMPKTKNLYIDIGARDREEAKTMVMVGDTAAFSGALSGNGNRVMGPYLDNRAGCAVLLETMQQTQHPTNDLYYVFTTQEEVGMRGAKPAAWAVDPEYALAVDVTCPDDQPGALHEATTKLGGGAAIKIMDHSVLCHREVVAKLRQLAAEKKIPAQDDLLKVGGTDAGVIHVSRGGVRTGGVSIPCRYTHSQTELIDLADLEACVKLVQAFCESEFE